MYFDQAKADRAINFIKHLCHTKGKWKGVPFTILPWQEQALSDVFGTMRDAGYRQYNTAYLEICKKQGKSELGAGVALYCLTADDEWAAEVYGCASDRQQASIVFDVAVDMVDQNKTLRKLIKPVLSQKRLVYLPTKSFYQVLSSESYTKHGLNVAACVFDEIHSAPNRELYDVMTEGSGDARTQPMFFFITTAGDDPDKKSVGWDLHSMATDILTGARIDPTFYAMLYGIDRDNKRIWTGRDYITVDGDVDWQDEEVWKLVNPSVDHTVPIEKMRDQFTRAKGNIAREKNFRWLRLNSWEKIKTSKWVPLENWDMTAGIVIPERLNGRACYGGIDLSSSIDLTAFALAFPPTDNDPLWRVLWRFYIPEDNFKERVRRDGVQYDRWIKEGFIKTTPGNVVDYAFIREDIKRQRDQFDIKEIGFDPWHALQLSLDLTDDGLTMVEVRQGFKTMSPAMKYLEKLILGCELVHGGNPVARWNFGNLEVKIDENENLRPMKGKSIERIDGIVALINALARAILHENNSCPYNSERGILML